jgi:hypothetical protein
MATSEGLQVVSPHGDFSVPVATVLAGGIRASNHEAVGCSVTIGFSLRVR